MHGQWHSASVPMTWSESSPNAKRERAKMETDREVLLWFHDRLIHRYKESELFDYMHRLRWIIYATHPTKTSRGQNCPDCCNSMKNLRRLLNKKDKKRKG